MKTLEEVNEILKHHIEVAIDEVEPSPPVDGDWDKFNKQLERNKRAYAKEHKRLLLMRNYLERVTPENVAANHKRLSDKIQRIEQRWKDHSASLGYVTETVLKKRKREYEKETNLPKLKKQLKEISWLVQ